MQASKLSFRYWFIAMHLLTGTKKTFSALELQRQIGHKFYEPIWYMLQKLRTTMGLRDRNYPINKIVELDEGFFESVDTEKEKKDKDEKKKRGRGSQKQSTVMVMASTIHDFNTRNKHNKPTKFGYVRMLVVDNLKDQTVEQKVKGNISPDSVMKTDNYRSYSKVKDNVWCHIAQQVKPKDAGKVLPWIQTMISNAKRTLLGAQHMLSKKYVQNYLDEFCYKVNRRYFGEELFDRLLIACVTINYKDIIKDYR
jgi:transposase-like protein